MDDQFMPKLCPDCGGSKLVRILWCYYSLRAEEKDAVLQHRLILGLSFSYCGKVDKDGPTPLILLEKSRLPTWACLECKPEWLDLHELMFSKLNLDDSMTAAVISREYDQASVFSEALKKLKEKEGPEVLRLIGLLIGADARVNPP
jgi:hypothetical protein